MFQPILRIQQTIDVLYQIMFISDNNVARFSLAKLLKCETQANILEYALYHGTPDFLTVIRLTSDRIDYHPLVHMLLYTIICLLSHMFIGLATPIRSATCGSMTHLVQILLLHYKLIDRQFYAWEFAIVFTLFNLLYDMFISRKPLKTCFRSTIRCMFVITVKMTVFRTALVVGEQKAIVALKTYAGNQFARKQQQLAGTISKIFKK